MQSRRCIVFQIGAEDNDVNFLYEYQLAHVKKSCCFVHDVKFCDISNVLINDLGAFLF